MKIFIMVLTGCLSVAFGFFVGGVTPGWRKWLIWLLGTGMACSAVFGLSLE